MELRRYIEVLDARKWVVVVTTLVTLLVVALGTARMMPTYSASATVRITPIQDNSSLRIDLNYQERLMNTYVQLLKSRPLLEDVISRLGLSTDPEDLAAALKVEALADTELIKITAESSDPRQAAAIADMLAKVLIEQGQRVYSGPGKSAREILQEQMDALQGTLNEDRARYQELPSAAGNGASANGETKDLSTKIQVEEEIYASLLEQYEKARLAEAVRDNSTSLVEPATIPVTPSKPRRTLNLILGALIGLIGGIGLVFLFENLDSAIHSTDDLEEMAGVALLATIPSFRVPGRARGRPVLVNGTGPLPASEAFQILGSNILAYAPGTPPRTILVVSAEQSAGKSVVAANLAVAMAKAGRGVILVDGDLRHSCLHQMFDLSNKVGLSDVILGSAEIQAGLQSTEVPGLRVLTSGPAVANPAALLGSRRMKQLVGQLAECADTVLFDVPPVLGMADTPMLAPAVDGVVLVAARDQSTRRRVQKALQQLDRVGARVLGTVFNKAKMGEVGYYYHYHRRPESEAGGGFFRRLAQRIARALRPVSPHHGGGRAKGQGEAFPNDKTPQIRDARHREGDI